MALDLTEVNKTSNSRIKRNPYKKATLAPWETHGDIAVINSNNENIITNQPSANRQSTVSEPSVEHIVEISYTKLEENIFTYNNSSEKPELSETSYKIQEIQSQQSVNRQLANNNPSVKSEQSSIDTKLTNVKNPDIHYSEKSLLLNAEKNMQSEVFPNRQLTVSQPSVDNHPVKKKNNSDYYIKHHSQFSDTNDSQKQKLSENKQKPLAPQEESGLPNHKENFPTSLPSLMKIKQEKLEIDHQSTSNECKHNGLKVNEPHELNRQLTVSQPSVNRQLTVSQPSALHEPNRQLTVSSIDNFENAKINNLSTVSEPSAKPSVNHQLTVGQPSAKPSVELNVNSLVGKKLILLNFIHEQCKLSGELQTNPISSEILNNVLNMSTGGIRTLLWELKRDGFLDYTTLKKGRIGLRQFILPKFVHRELYLNSTVSQPSANRQLTVGQFVSQPSAQPSVDSSSSNSNNNINNTTNTKIDDEWSEVEIPEVLTHLNFNSSIIRQVKERSLVSPKELQESLNAFAFDIAENNIIKTKNIQNLTGYFMGIMNKKSPYIPSSNYTSDEERAHAENIKRLEELKKKREEMEKVKLDLAFEEWLLGLTEEDKAKILPQDGIFMPGGEFHTNLLKAHFKNLITQGQINNH